MQEETHYCVPKAARIARFRDRQIRRIGVDSRRRIDTAALARAVEADRAEGLLPYMISLTRWAFEQLRADERFEILDGRYTIRLCVLSFRTHMTRVKDAVEALQEEASVLLASPPSAPALASGAATT